ncbi:MAG: hypothetical protein JWN40_3346 [Phycisphaerales bacterium]|nr:hypothetical protein [Phycisphaerales bacterium]
MKWIACIVTVLALGCADRPRTMRQLPDGRVVPDHWSDFVSTTAQDLPTARVQYDSLYIAGPREAKEAYHRDAREIWYACWYRFWPEGQVLVRERRTHQPGPWPPTAADGDEFGGGVVGRYCVIGDRIRMEFTGLGETGSTYVRQEGRVNSDGSFTLSPAPPEFPDGTFRRLQVGEMKRAADW